MAGIDPTRHGIPRRVIVLKPFRPAYCAGLQVGLKLEHLRFLIDQMIIKLLLMYQKMGPFPSLNQPQSDTLHFTRTPT